MGVQRGTAERRGPIISHEVTIHHSFISSQSLLIALNLTDTVPFSSVLFRERTRAKGEKKRCKGVDKAMRWIMHGIRIIVVVISSFGFDHPLFRGNHQETIIISISDVNHPYLTTARQII